MSGEPRGTRSAAGYARTVTEWWSDATGRPHLLSPKDWHVVSDWYERGVPLAVVREALDAVTAKARSRGREPRRFHRLAALVEETWATLVDGRVGEDDRGDDLARPDPVAAWRSRRDRDGEDSPLGALLTGLLARLDAGAEPAEIDQELERELEAAVDTALVDTIRAEVDAELEGYRDRISAGTLGATRLRAVRTRLRRLLEIPTLTGTPNG